MATFMSPPVTISLSQELMIMARVLCEGYYCQVFSDSDCTNEIDSFCLAEGVEITDLSDEAVAAGIKSYLG